jgi:hypothetical protein
MNMTARTLKYTLRERHDLSMSTPAACLTRIGRVDFDELSASLFRFARQLSKECRPRGICNAFSETMVMDHTVDREVFHTDGPEAINDLSTFLMGEIIAPEPYTFMDPCHGFSVLTTLRRPFSKFAMLTLHFCQGLLFLAEKAGMGDFRSIREGRKGFESHINPHLGRIFRQPFRFTLHREGDVPLASGSTSDGTGLDLAPDGPVVDHLDGADLREADPVIMSETEARLRKGEGVIAMCPTETRKARLLTGFAASKEGFEGQVNTHRHILQDLRMDCLKRETILLQDREGIDLSIERESLACLLVGVLALFQQVIIEPTTLLEGLIELVQLFLGWIDAILKHFMYIVLVAQTEQGVKRETAPPLRGTPLTSPKLVPGVLRGGLIKGNYCTGAVVIALARLFDVRYSPPLHDCYLTTVMESHAHTQKS